MSPPLFILLTLLAGGSNADPQPQEPLLVGVVRVSVVDRALRIEWRGPGRPPAKSLRVAGPEARWTLRAPLGRPDALELERPPARAGEPSGYWYAAVTASPAGVTIAGHRAGTSAQDYTLSFTQTADGAVRMLVADNLRRKKTNASAKDVLELRAKHPQLVRAFLVPALRQLAGHDPLLPGPADVYQVFEEISPDEAVAAKVNALLPELGELSFDRRERATQRLEALGAPAVCAVLRIDRDALMPEQKMRLEEFLLANSRRTVADPASLRDDVAFLADCLEFTGDDRVRRTAHERLERITGRPIPLHHAPTEEEWSHAADLIRARSAEATEASGRASRPGN